MQSEEQRLAYINREMAIMDYNSDMEGCREEGREQGLEQGRLDLIKSLLAVGTPMKYICKASGMTENEILALGK